MKIGIVGYSGRPFDYNIARDCIYNCFRNLQYQYGDNILVISALTDLGIPALSYRIAKLYGWKTWGIGPEESFEYTTVPKLFLDDIEVVGKKFRDESVYFLEQLDLLIAFGGGEQTKTELQMAKDKGIPVMVYHI